ncbi:single-stranded DNA-binding protein [Streptomyces phaeoluteigriseus]|uniref:single-stranded DNA-binding protein n=1 Tax=Streptomyces phaeoluteigriseus TaxID=114686 RepID=UPI001FE2E46C|nr:single-stranded DNA-binding protein [Streptomyces phaeoluteigriseus]
MAPSVTQVSGTVTGDVEVRFTDSGVAVCRFRLTQTPTQWDAAAQQWRDGTPIGYVCTAWRDLARNATESLTDGVSVLIMGRITEIRDNVVYLSVDDLGISLRQRIAYTETSLPSLAAAAPISPTASVASVAAPRSGAARRGGCRWPGRRSGGRPARLVGAAADRRMAPPRRPHSGRRRPLAPPLPLFTAPPDAAPVRLPVPPSRSPLHRATRCGTGSPAPLRGALVRLPAPHHFPCWRPRPPKATSAPTAPPV